MRDSLASMTEQATADAGNYMDDLSDVYTTLLDVISAPVLAVFNAHIVALQQRLTNVQNAAAAFPATMQSAQASLSQAVANEASARSLLSAQWAASMTPLEGTIPTKINEAANSRNTLRASKTSNDPTNSITAMFASATNNEANRQVSELSGQTTAFNNLKTSFSTAVLSAFNTQAAQFASTCASKVSAVTSYNIDVLTGETDEMNW
jgi:hypothetical protein